MPERLSHYQPDYDRRYEALPRLVKSYLRIGEALRKPNLKSVILGQLYMTQELVFKSMLPEEIKEMRTFLEWRDKKK